MQSKPYSSHQCPNPRPEKQQTTTRYDLQPYARYEKIVAYSKQHENNILNSLSWRQSTSMPIVKVMGYTSKPIVQNSYYFSQLITVEFEEIIKNIGELNNIDINQCLYLVREFLLGLQTLSIKFNYQLDLNKAFFGINNKGQAKVWFNNKFLQYPNSNSIRNSNVYNKKIYHIIDHLFQVVGGCVKYSQKTSFEQIGQRIVSQQNITYAEAHSKLRKLSNQLGICIPNCISAYGNQYNSKNNTAKKQKESQKFINYSAKANKLLMSSLKNQDNRKNRELSKLKLSSPPFASINNFSAKKIMGKSIQKSKLSWRGQNSTNNKCRLKNSFINQNGIFNQRLRSLIDSIKKKTSSNIRRNQDSLKQKEVSKSVPTSHYRHKVNSSIKINKISQSQQQQIFIKQFNPLNEQQNQSLQNSEVWQKASNQNSISTGRSDNKIGMSNANTEVTKNQRQSKISFDSQSFIMDSSNLHRRNSFNNDINYNFKICRESIKQFKQKCYNKVKLEQLVQNSKNIVNSIMIANSQNTASAANSRAYNFGGLITIQAHNPSSQNTQIDGKQTQSLQASRQQALISQRSEKNLQKNQKQLQQQGKIGIQMQFGLDIMMAKFFTKDTKDLKQSVWCGEEKKAEHLHIKLQKLGNFGRQICQSYIPQ